MLDSVRRKDLPEMAAADKTITDARLRRFVGYKMKRAFNAIRTDLNAALAPFDLRLITFSALAVIEENPGLNQSQLAEMLDVERPNLVVIVDELEKRGLIRRSRSEDDRRSNVLDLTDDGAAFFAQALAAVERHEARMTQGLTPAQYDDLHHALGAVARSSSPEET